MAEKPGLGFRNFFVHGRDVSTRVLGYPGPVWPTRVPTRVP